MKHVPTCLAVALALAVTPMAAAKFALTELAVCGSAACATTRDEALLDELSRLMSPPESALTVVPAIGPYFALRADRGLQFGYMVRGRDAIQWSWPGTAPLWVTPTQDSHAKLAQTQASVAPFPAPRPVRVVVNGRRVRDPASYVALLSDLDRAPQPRAMGPRWIPVTFVWGRTNPWSDASSMFFDPDDRALFRGGAWYRVPPALLRKITKPRTFPIRP